MLLCVLVCVHTYTYVPICIEARSWHCDSSITPILVLQELTLYFYLSGYCEECGMCMHIQVSIKARSIDPLEL